MGFLTARYDSGTKKISGCEKGSYAWWHEKGHEYQDKHGWFGYIMKLGWWLFRIGFIVSIHRLGQGVPLGLYEWLFLVGFVFEIFIEAHAHLGGFKSGRKYEIQVLVRMVSGWQRASNGRFRVNAGYGLYEAIGEWT